MTFTRVVNEHADHKDKEKMLVRIKLWP
jgi:hypothetical protein